MEHETLIPISLFEQLLMCDKIKQKQPYSRQHNVPEILLWELNQGKVIMEICYIRVISVISQCTENTCSQNGDCVDGLNGATVCRCDEGWTAPDCSTSIDDCNPNPCHYNGTCEDKHLDFDCTCPPYKQGKTCAEGTVVISDSS